MPVQVVQSRKALGSASQSAQAAYGRKTRTDWQLAKREIMGASPHTHREVVCRGGMPSNATPIVRKGKAKKQVQIYWVSSETRGRLGGKEK